MTVATLESMINLMNMAQINTYHTVLYCLFEVLEPETPLLSRDAKCIEDFYVIDYNMHFSSERIK